MNVRRGVLPILACSSASGVALMFGPSAVVIACAIGVSVAVPMLLGRSLPQRLTAAVALLDSGAVPQAEAALRALAREVNARDRAALESFAAMARLRAGDREAAIAEWLRVRARDGKCGRANNLTSVSLAYAHALAGDLEGARAFRASAADVKWCMADAVMAARAATPVPVAPVALSGHEQRVYAAVRAVAGHRDALANAAPSFAGELDYLAAQWPAMRLLLTEQDWCARAVSPPRARPLGAVLRDALAAAGTWRAAS